MRGRDAPVRRPARPPGPRPGLPGVGPSVPIALCFFCPPRPAPEGAHRPPGPRGMARPGARGPVRGPSGGPVVGRPSAGIFTQVPIGRRDRTPPARAAGEVVPGPCACWRGTVSPDATLRSPGPAVGTGAGPCGGGTWRARWTGTGARAAPGRSDSTFPLPRFPASRDQAAGPVGVSHWRPVRRRRLGGTFPLTPPPQVPDRRRGRSWRPLPAPATVAVGSISCRLVALLACLRGSTRWPSRSCR